jgi:hypothetical protein
MWLYKGEEYKSEMIGEAVGFVYLLTDLVNGMKYVGKKKFWRKITKPPLKGKTRKRKEIKESDWQTYYGSSETTKQLVEEHGGGRFKREILHICYGLGAMSYMELVEQVQREVLFRDDYYNGIIQVRIHRSHIKSLKKDLQSPPSEV